MSEELRRRYYRDERVLIASSRILAPQFDDSLVCLTGAQLELLRNVMQYLNRDSTFVATYYPDYYLIPDNDGLDAINAIVADLEETLMGCTEIVAYLAAIAFDTNLLNLARPLHDACEELSTTSDGTALLYHTFTEVPEGYICKVWLACGADLSNACTHIRIEVRFLTLWRALITDSTISPGEPTGLYNPFVLQEGMQVRIRYYGTTNGDSLRSNLVAHYVEQP